MAATNNRAVTVRLPLWAAVLLSALFIAGVAVAGYVIGHGNAPDSAAAASAKRDAERTSTRRAEQLALAQYHSKGYAQGITRGRAAGRADGELSGQQAGREEGDKRAVAAAAAAQRAAPPNQGCPANTHASGNSCIGNGSPAASPIGNEQTCSGGKECELPTQTLDRPSP